MSTPVLPPYVPPFKPVPQITPFTYRDGVTYLDKLESIVRWVNFDLIPFVNDNYSELADDFEEQVNILIAAVNAAIQEVINSSITVQDPVVAQLINDVASQTRIALDALYDSDADIVSRVWDGTAYPARIDGYVNLFIGPNDPGLLMDEDDLWANPDLTTINELIAQLAINNSPFNNAVMLAAADNPIIVFGVNDLQQDPASTAVVKQSFGTSPNQHIAWVFPSTSISRLFGSFIVPKGWNSFRVRVFFYHTTVGGTGNVYFTANFTAYGDNLPINSGVGQSFPIAARNENIVAEAVSTVSWNCVPGKQVSFSFARNATAGPDTLENAINFLGMRIERAS